MSQPTVSPDVAILRRLVDLEQQVAALQRSGQLANAGVRVVTGPAAQSQNKGIIILDGSSAERVRLGVTDSDLASPSGAASLYGASAKDTNGKVRAMFGQMVNAQGATDYGAAAYDANGNVLWDSSGLVAVVSDVGTFASNSGTYSPPADGTWHDVTGVVTGSFTLRTSLGLLALCNFNGTVTGGSYLQVRIAIKSGATVVATSTVALQVPVSAATSLPFMLYYTGVVAAGTYTAQLQALNLSGTGTNTLGWQPLGMDVFRLGS